MFELQVEKGTVYVYYAFDIGVAVDLAKVEPLLAGEKSSMRQRGEKKVAKYFEFTPAPLRLVETSPTYHVCQQRFSTASNVELLLFDFGCVSVQFEIPIQGPLQDLIGLSVELYENGQLQDAAKHLVVTLLDKIRAIVEAPEIAARVEDYFIFHLERINPNLSIKDLLERHISEISCILRAETGAPSERQTQEVLSDRISYGLNDVTLMSWYCAVICGENAEDIYAVLEFANLVLLELSYLDSRLDKSLEEFYDYFTKQRRKWFSNGLRSKQPLIRRISNLQIEGAILFEGVTNALKLMGDDFQARVFQLTTRKMGLSAWDASISRKLQTIESIYKKISDAEGARRMEMLEVIVILLIILSMVLPVVFPKLGIPFYP